MITTVDIAIGQLGVKESGGHNCGEPFDLYALPGEQPLAWCARFLRWCFALSGHRLPGNPYEIANVANLHDALEAAGAILPNPVAPRRGDILLLNKHSFSDRGARGNHTGLIESADATNIHSIDGNWGDCVQRVTRKADAPEIWCFARWPKEPTA